MKSGLQKFIFIAALMIITPCAAADLVLEMPVECKMGEVCYVQNYFDRDPGPESRDYKCGRLTYDGHTGTDIRVPDMTVMREGVNVLAVADGVVRAIREGVEDVNVTEIGFDAVKGREAGNAVAVRHEDGWETQYSHLKKGSIRVKPGEKVKAGQILGQIGLSGKTQFPHVELSVRLNGESIDPFVGVTDRQGCGFVEDPLWSEAAAKRLEYISTGLLSAGFTSAVPDPEEARNGKHQAETLTITAPMIIFWTNVFGAEEGDVEKVTLTGPDGDVLADISRKQDAFMARHFVYIGKHRRGAPWPEGTYVGRYLLTRAGESVEETVLDISRKITVK